MIDHLLGRPSVKSRRLQVLAVLGFWSAYLLRGNKHGPPFLRFLSRLLSKQLTAWQTVVITMIYLYAARNFSTLVGLASPDPLANMYDATYFRATWVLTALDAGFWTAMKISNKTLRDLASIVFSVFYMAAAEKADEKVRKVRGNITVEHLRVSWNKGSQSPYLRFLQNLVRPRFMRWPPRAIRIPRPATSDYKDPVSGWLYFDGPLSELENHNHIVLDIPGGGFVAMNPRCNDDKLFAWAAKTGLPVLSLDYRKAPEYPYPYALNECYDVYTTIIKSRGRCIGLSGKEVPKVVITGDSAGGNLAAATTLMIIESGSSPVRRFQGQPNLPIPDGLLLFYPGLDMNIGSWMSDEQMALIKDRRMRGTNKRIIERKTMQYNDLVGTPHPSDDEDDTTPSPTSPSGNDGEREGAATGVSSAGHVRTPAPEYAHSGPSTWSHIQPGPAPPAATPATAATLPSPEPMRTRLAMSSMISYFNDRVLAPEMMRAMIILYVGPHNRPDFSQDYLLSPILAPDALLARFPKTYFLTGERDPLVDDTVVFAGRLRRVKAAQIASDGERFEYRESDAQAEGFDERDVAEMVLIPGISHGFLQFPGIYPPSWKLIDRTGRWIEEVFERAERRERRERERERGRGRAVVRDELGIGVSRDGDGDGRNINEDGNANVNGNGNAAMGARTRHHFRQESSGDERPLMMSMTTRGRGRLGRERGGGINVNELSKENKQKDDGIEKEGGAPTAARDPAVPGKGTATLPNGDRDDSQSVPLSSTTTKNENGHVNGTDDVGNGTNNSGNGSGNGNGKRKKNARRVRTSSSKEDDKSLVKLASSEDLLGRRMNGLAGGLTGLRADLE
ncbi:Hormone-sensitive lipase [Madurella mycetomatis]|uniref:Hormone-sensitive lipase n=1 Tax=Madurella mycetomatis TaxID=100816 RepID=A0A175W2J3_9PEZI|nr:Hormone-sensitive lipase [Madurella mycetomatis]